MKTDSGHSTEMWATNSVFLARSRDGSGHAELQRTLPEFEGFGSAV